MKTQKAHLARSVFAAASAGAVLIGGFLAGAAVASASSNEPVPAPSYQRNDAGMTYGSALDARTIEEIPDLIKAEATNGRIGYVKQAELDEVSGASVSNPEEALAWNKEVETRRTRGESIEIPVYLSDGVTQIGVFTIDTSGELVPAVVSHGK